jgi:hypothetical protein
MLAKEARKLTNNHLNPIPNGIIDKMYNKIKIRATQGKSDAKCLLINEYRDYADTIIRDLSDKGYKIQYKKIYWWDMDVSFDVSVEHDETGLCGHELLIKW